jgi:pyruvate dehydrogenase E2 component (dihydrolipoamide acetyltransferase)
MFGIKHFEAVINPSAGDDHGDRRGREAPLCGRRQPARSQRSMSATGSFDHRAIDGADGARLMKAFKELVESPLGLVA